MSRLGALTFFDTMRWIDRTPLRAHIEPYRRGLFTAFLDDVDAAGRPRYNLGLFGRAKKNWKTADMILAAYHALLDTSPHGNQVLLVANDEGQAAEGLELAKKLILANSGLLGAVTVREKSIERKDRWGSMTVLPAQSAVGEHGKTFRFLGVDELHGHRNWDLLEALQPDPHRLDAQTWLASYASIYHVPGAPLHDLIAQGKAGTDPRMLFSWYAGDFTTDAAYADADPETRANPSRGSWADPDGYLPQQKRRLPTHKFNRLHLNLPGLPEGSAYTPEMVAGAIDRGVWVRAPEAGVAYRGAADMSGGSNDDATCAIGHQAPDGTVVLDVVMNQGQPPPFDPRQAVLRFAERLRVYGVREIRGDGYGGLTFRQDFERAGIEYVVSERTTSEGYEAFEPLLNGRRVRLLDVPVLEQQLLGLVWRGNKIDHPSGDHDDYACAAVGVLTALAGPEPEEARLW